MHPAARLLKVDPNTVRKWEKYELKCLIKATRFEKKFYFIKPEDFWCWAYENREKIND